MSGVTRSAGQTRTQEADKDTLQRAGARGAAQLTIPFILNLRSVSQPQDQRPHHVFPGAELNQGGKTPRDRKKKLMSS